MEQLLVILIVCIVGSVIKNFNKEANHPTNSNSRQPNSGNRAQTVERTYQARNTAKPSVNKPYQESSTVKPYANKPTYQATKAVNPPVNHSYQEQKPVYEKSTSDILNRANQNIREQEEKDVKSVDMNIRSQRDQRAVVKQVHQNVLQEDHLMERLEDLMIKGYEPSLSCKRDFISEGLELMGRIQLNDIPVNLTKENHANQNKELMSVLQMR